VSRQHDLDIALRLADLASDAALRWFRSPELGVEKKADGSVVTTADVEIEQMLRDELARTCPKDAVLGEELGATGEDPRVWTLDPIDGTSGFVAGDTGWATLIALVEEDVPVVGVVSRPARDSRSWAGEGLGSFKDGQSVRVSETPRLAEAVLLEDFRVSVGRRLDTNPMTALARASAGVRPWLDIYVASALADGSVDVVLLWYAGSGPDLYSSVCIVTEAGGRWTDLKGALDVEAPVQLATNGRLHDETLAFVNDLIARGVVNPANRPTEDIAAIKAARRNQVESVMRVRS
jgi:histidinol-phosphatase